MFFSALSIINTCHHRPPARSLKASFSKRFLRSTGLCHAGLSLWGIFNQHQEMTTQVKTVCVSPGLPVRSWRASCPLTSPPRAIQEGKKSIPTCPRIQEGRQLSAKLYCKTFWLGNILDRWQHEWPTRSFHHSCIDGSIDNQPLKAMGQLWVLSPFSQQCLCKPSGAPTTIALEHGEKWIWEVDQSPKVTSLVGGEVGTQIGHPFSSAELPYSGFRNSTFL